MFRVCISALVCAAVPAAAADRTWTAAAGNAWGIPVNWTGGVPGAGDIARFDDTAAEFTVTLGGNRSVAQLHINTDIGYTLSGPANTLTCPTLSHAGFGASTIAANVVAGGTWTVTGDGGLTVNGNLGGAGGLTKAGGGTLTLTGTNTGGLTVNAGTLALAGTSTAIAAIAVNSGATLRLDSSNNFGNHASAAGPAITVTGGTVYSPGGSINALQSLTLNGGTLSADDGLFGYGSYSVRGTLTSTGASAVNIDANNAGALALGHDGNTTFAVASGTLTVNARVIDNAGVVGQLVKTGAGTLTLAGSTEHTGGTAVNVGTLALAGNSQLAGTFTVASGATLRFDASDNFGDRYSELGPAVVANGGTVAAAANTHTTFQDLTLNGGTLATAGGTGGYGSYSIRGTLTSSGASAITEAGTGVGTIALGFDSDTHFDVTGGTLTVNARIVDNESSNGKLIKTGGGTLLLAGTNSFTGGIDVDGGTVALAGSVGQQAGLGASTFTVNSDGTLRFDGNGVFGNHDIATAPAVVVTGGTVTNSGSFINTLQNLTLADGTLAAVGGFGTFGAFSVRGIVTSTGTSSIAFPAGADLTLSHAGTTTFDVQDGTLTVNARVINNVSPNVGRLVKTGDGTLILRQANTYTGATTVSAGTLRLEHPSAVAGSATVTVAAGATLDLGGGTLTLATAAGQTLAGTGTVDGSIAVPSGTAISPGSGVGTLTVIGDVAFTAGGRLAVRVNGSAADDDGSRSRLYSEFGTLTFAGTTANPFVVAVSKFGTATEAMAGSFTLAKFADIGYGGLDNALTLVGNGSAALGGVRLDVSGFASPHTWTLQRLGNVVVLGFTPVPEPAWALAASAAAGLGWRWRRAIRGIASSPSYVPGFLIGG